MIRLSDVRSVTSDFWGISLNLGWKAPAVKLDPDPPQLF